MKFTNQYNLKWKFKIKFRFQTGMLDTFKIPRYLRLFWYPFEYQNIFYRLEIRFKRYRTLMPYWNYMVSIPCGWFRDLLLLVGRIYSAHLIPGKRRDIFCHFSFSKYILYIYMMNKNIASDTQTDEIYSQSCLTC